MKSKSLKSIQFSKEERNFWKNLEINIDSFSDRWNDLYKADFEKRISVLSIKFIKDVVSHFNIKIPTGKTKSQTLLEDRRHSIITYCIIIFSLRNPKILSEFFKIPIVRKEVDKVTVIEKAFEQYTRGLLTDLFLFLLKQKLGKRKYSYAFTDSLRNEDYQTILDFMPKLEVFLRRHEKTKKLYSFRFGYKGGTGEWIFLLLKETNDKVYKAIPNNISMISGTYKLVSVRPGSQSMEIHTNSRDEALLVRNYFTKKLDNRYTYKRNEKKYEPKQFFAKVLTDSPNSNLRLIDVKFKDSNIGVKIQVSDRERKHDIISQLRFLQSNNVLKLKDFSEFETLTFYFNGLNIKIQIFETAWGLHKLNLVDRGISPKDIQDFNSRFSNKFGVPLDVWLKRSDEEMNKVIVISKILDRKTIPVYTVTKDIEDTLLELMSNKILNKLQYQAKRICEVCFTKTWEKGSCPTCGNNMRIDGDFIEVKTNEKGIYDYTFKALSAITNINISKTNVQISRTKHTFIEVMNKNGDNLFIYISANDVPEEIISHFHINALPLLVMLTRYKEALAQNLQNNNFEVVGLVDFYINSTKALWLSNSIKRYLENQKLKWKQKLLDKGYDSYTFLKNKKADYSPQNFETDIFNLFHELFYIAFKLGGNFTGIAAPDGIVSIQNQSKPLSKFCLSWDCKFSNHSKGYQLNEKISKHRHYINTLKNNSRVKFYGSLKVHAIISQNMNFPKYEKFYNKMKYKFQWKGEILFIEETILLLLYNFYRINSVKILSQPSLFYSSLYRLFLKIHSKDREPFPTLSSARLEIFFKEVATKYSKFNVELKFNRKDF